jgi:hypothetical protein
MEKKKKTIKKTMKKKSGSREILKATATAVAMLVRKRGAWL